MRRTATRQYEPIGNMVPDVNRGWNNCFGITTVLFVGAILGLSIWTLVTVRELKHDSKVIRMNTAPNAPPMPMCSTEGACDGNCPGGDALTECPALAFDNPVPSQVVIECTTQTKTCVWHYTLGEDSSFAILQTKEPSDDLLAQFADSPRFHHLCAQALDLTDATTAAYYADGCLAIGYQATALTDDKRKRSLNPFLPWHVQCEVTFACADGNPAVPLFLPAV